MADERAGSGAGRRPEPIGGAVPSAQATAPANGVLIRADNGDVVTFDQTGLTLRLSDRVVADLRRRLGGDRPALDPLEILGDIDVWDLRESGDFYAFSALLEPEIGPRAYLRPRAGGDIIAAAPGPLRGLLTFGGARRAGFNRAPPLRRYNILAPGDDIGAVGLEATASAAPNADLQHIAHSTRESLLADRLLAAWRQAGRAPGLFLARAETDSGADMTQIADGIGYANFRTAVGSLRAAAQRLGKAATIAAIGLDLGFEDPQADDETLVAGWRRLLTRIEGDLRECDIGAPVFLTQFAAAGRWPGDTAPIRAHWRLTWDHGGHDLVFTAPEYMFDFDRFGRPSEAARARMADMDCQALLAREAGQDWFCPLLLLADQYDHQIKVTARALSDLIVDGSDPFGTGPAAGFSLRGTAEPVRITAVRPATEDPAALILECDRAPGPAAGGAVELCYGLAPDGPGGPQMPMAGGALRDEFSARASVGNALHRWAYPAILPLRPTSETAPWS